MTQGKLLTNENLRCVVMISAHLFHLQLPRKRPAVTTGHYLEHPCVDSLRI